MPAPSRWRGRTHRADLARRPASTLVPIIALLAVIVVYTDGEWALVLGVVVWTGLEILRRGTCV